MGKSVTVVHWLLLTLGLVAAQAEKAEQVLPNWLTGIIAVGVFFFLIFVTFLVNKAWCETPSKPEAVPIEYAMTNVSTRLDAVRSIDDPNAYENAIVHQTDEKATEM
ncbi:PDZK1-interacting protein 1 [Cyprinus carpio]|uniref:PDZK1-interacting protein 1 n=2 Tax=Cyprinus carpio TaxID=7962 RepID=A0A8C1PFM9_CYPCA|nr:PDZK1-interacting protein 1 [Cyprinus carpio]